MKLEITFPTLIIHLLLIGQSMVFFLIGKIHSGFVFYASGRNSQQKYFMLPETLEILRKSPFKRNEFYKLEYVLRHISITYIATHQLKLFLLYQASVGSMKAIVCILDFTTMQTEFIDYCVPTHRLQTVYSSIKVH